MPFYNVSVGMTEGGWANIAADFLMKKINGEDLRCREMIPVKLIEFNKM